MYADADSGLSPGSGPGFLARSQVIVLGNEETVWLGHHRATVPAELFGDRLRCSTSQPSWTSEPCIKSRRLCAENAKRCEPLPQPKSPGSSTTLPTALPAAATAAPPASADHLGARSPRPLVRGPAPQISGRRLRVLPLEL
jgi:hypothetical protein